MDLNTFALAALLAAGMPGVSEMEQRYYIRQQHDDSCGFASAASILSCYYDIPADEADLIESVIIPSEEQSHTISLQDISDLLAAEGIYSQGFRLDQAVLSELTGEYGPLICWDSRGDGHFFLLLSVIDLTGQDIFVTADPAAGKAYLDADKFGSFWSGKALLTASQEKRILLSYSGNLEDELKNYLLIHESIRGLSP